MRAAIGRRQIILIIIRSFFYSAFLGTQRRFTKRNAYREYRHSNKRQINNPTTTDNPLREGGRWKMAEDALVLWPV